MDLRQFGHFVQVVELGNLDRAALAFGMSRAELDEEIRFMETRTSVRLLDVAGSAVLPTDAGLSFLREAQLTLRHAEQAARVAQDHQVTGTVNVGLTPTIGSVLGLPLLLETRRRYPGIRLHLVESLSGHLAQLLSARQLDIAVLYDTRPVQRLHASALLDERLYLIQSNHHRVAPPLGKQASLADLRDLPLILPTGSHSLRHVLDAAFHRAHAAFQVSLEIDSLAMLMEAVDAGLGATIQPWSATRRFPDAAERFELTEIVDRDLARASSLCSLGNAELSPAALATRVLLAVCAREQVRCGAWHGARIRNH